MKAITVFHCSHVCTHAYTELGEVTHFQAGSPMNKCSDRTKKKPDRDDCISRSLSWVFLIFFPIVRVPAISFDTLTAKDVKDQDSPVNIQHAIYSLYIFLYFFFCFMLTLNKNSMVLKLQLL